MGMHNVAIKAGVTIPNGTTLGNILLAHKEFEDADTILIQVPAVFPEVLRIKVSANPAAAVAADFVDLLNPATGAVYTAAAGQGIQIEAKGIAALSLGTTANVGADRVFLLAKGMGAL